MSKGRMLIYSGRVSDGLALLDEAMVGLSADEVSPVFAGLVYCALIEACQELSDFARAVCLDAGARRLVRCSARPRSLHRPVLCAQRTGAAAARRLGGCPGRVRDRRAPVRRPVAHPARRADWPSSSGGICSGSAANSILSEEAYSRAAALGREPQPGLTLLWVARGRTEPGPLRCSPDAGLLDPDSVARSSPSSRRGRGAGRRRTAGRRPPRPLDELAAIATEFDSFALQAMAAYASASFSAGGRGSRGCVEPARDSCRRWLDLDCPYEVARARMLVARGLRELDDEESAGAELFAAPQPFWPMSAKPASGRRTPPIGRPAPGGITEREIEVLRLVAEGRSNADIAAALYLSQKTVARHLSNIFTKLDVTVQNRGGDVRASIRAHLRSATSPISCSGSTVLLYLEIEQERGSRAAGRSRLSTQLASAAFSVADGVITAVASCRVGAVVAADVGW